MEEYSSKAVEAFHWIITILHRHRIPYQVSGGLAAKVYGSQRPLVDIDIDIPDAYFAKLEPLVLPYIVLGPKQWRGEGFKVYIMTLEYKGQAIDIGGTDATYIWERSKNKWSRLTSDFEDYEMKRVMGKRVKVVQKKALIAYKMKLDRRVDRADLAYLH